MRYILVLLTLLGLDALNLDPRSSPAVGALVEADLNTKNSKPCGGGEDSQRQNLYIGWSWYQCVCISWPWHWCVCAEW